MFHAKKEFLSLGPKISHEGVFGGAILKTVVIFEISTLE